MLLTPHIVRTHELTEDDLAPIYIGTQQNLGLGGPPPLIAPQPDEPPAAAPPPAPAPARSRRAAARTRAAAGRRRRWRAADQPAGAAGNVARAELPAAAAAGGRPPAPAPAGRRRPTPPPATAAPPTTAVPSPAPTPVAPPRPPRDVAAASAERARAARRRAADAGDHHAAAGDPRGERAVHGAALDQQRVAAVDDDADADLRPDVLRVRTVQEGSFMRQGGVTATFTPHIDAVAGRVDITITRSGDQTGASGTGLLAALLFDAVGPGTSTLTVSGVASTPEGAPIGLQFTPVTVTVR